MIVTVTPNPRLDRTLEPATLARSELLRAWDRRVDPGGKGINVARALHDELAAEVRRRGAASVLVGPGAAGYLSDPPDLDRALAAGLWLASAAGSQGGLRSPLEDARP